MRKSGLNTVLILFMYVGMTGVVCMTHAETLVVTSCEDEPALDASVGPETAEGVVTLRSALEYANHPYSDTEHTICFDFPGTGCHRIELDAPLDDIIKPIVINGYSQRDACYADEEHQEILCVELSGAQAGKGADGLVIRSQAKGSVVKGLTITGFSGHGIVLDDVQDVVIFGNHIGTDLGGNRGVPNHGNGILVYGGTNNRIGGSERRETNLISGNHQSGVSLCDSHDTRVCGNTIGADITGTMPLANKASGITIVGGGDHEIGGHRDHAGNLISGNEGAGITIRESYANRIAGNSIGLAFIGNQPVPNSMSGIEIEQGSRENSIGGTESVFSNIISGNQGSGITISHADKNKVLGNVIGLARDGQEAPNHAFGIHIMNGASRNGIGGSEPGAGNTISGNMHSAIVVAEGFDTRIQGNTIGQDPTGSREVPNGGHGILLQNAQGTTIGGGSLGDFNRIVGNRKFAIKCDGGCSNTVIGNALYNNERKWALQLINEANNSIEAPRLSVENDGTVIGAVASVPHEEHIICFYSNPHAGRKEGTSFLGQQLIKTDAEGYAQFHLSPAVPLGGHLTATVTRKATGDTSRFSNDAELKGTPEVACVRTPVTPLGDDHYCSYTLTVSGSAEAGRLVMFREELPDDMSFVSVEQESGPHFVLRHPRVGEYGVIEGESSGPSGEEATFRVVVMKGQGAHRKMPRDEPYFGMSESTLARGIAYKLRDHMPLAQQVVLSDGSCAYKIELPTYVHDPYVRASHNTHKKTGVYDDELLDERQRTEQKDALVSPPELVLSGYEEAKPVSDQDSDDLNPVRSTLIDEDELQQLKVNPLSYQNNELSSRIMAKWSATQSPVMHHIPTVHDARYDDEEEEYTIIAEHELRPIRDDLVESEDGTDRSDLSVRPEQLGVENGVTSLLQYARPEEDEAFGRFYCVEDYPSESDGIIVTREYDEAEIPIEVKASVVPVFTQEELDYLREYEFTAGIEEQETVRKPSQGRPRQTHHSGSRRQPAQKKVESVYEYSSPWDSVAGPYYGNHAQIPDRYEECRGVYRRPRSTYSY